MAEPIGIFLDQAQYDELMEVLGSDAKVRKAYASAINKTLVTGRKNLKKRVEEKLNVGKKVISDAFKNIERASVSNLSGTLSILGRRVALRDFIGVTGGKNDPRGVSAVMIKGMGPVRFKHAFKATVASAAQAAQGIGHKAVFERVKGGRGGNGLTARGYAQRLPIKEIFGPTVLSLFGEAATTALAKEELEKLHDKFLVNLASAVDWQLGRKKSDRPPAEESGSGES